MLNTNMFFKLSTCLLAIAIANLFTPTNSLPFDNAAPSPVNYSASLPPTIIKEFPKGTWIENLVIRQSDGNAVTTILSAPEVYLISTTGEVEPRLLARFDGNLGCLGIVELGHDVFYVAVGNWSASTGKPTPGSWSIWEIDLRNFLDIDTGYAPTRQVAALPEGGFLNGMTVLNPATGVVLVADSLYSAVWSVNVRTGEVAVAINDTTMATLPEAADGLELGLNAISNRGDGYLYYDNTDRATFNRIPIDLLTGAATGPAQTLVQSNTSTIFADDFAIDFAGNAFLTSDPAGEVALLRNVTSGANPTIEIVAGSKDDKVITGFTAAKFGTSEEDLVRGSLYVTTNGGAASYAFSNWTSGGMLVRYDTARLNLYGRSIRN